MFTRNEIDEIATALESRGKKDSQFPIAESLSGTENIAIVQDGNNMRTSINDIITFFGNSVLSPVIEAITEAEQTLKDSIDTVNTDLSAGISDSKTEILNSIDTVFNNLNTTIDEATQSILDKFGNTSFGDIRDDIIDSVNNCLQTILSNLQDLYTNIKADISQSQDYLSTKIDNQFTSLDSTINSLEASIKSYIDNIVPTIQETIESTISSIKDDIESTINGNTDSKISDLSSTVNDLFNKLNTALESYFSTVNNSIQDSYNNILIRLNTVESNITDSVNSISDDIVNSENKLGQLIVDQQNDIAQILESFNGTINDNISAINSVILAKLDYYNTYWTTWRDRKCTLTVSTQVDSAKITLNNIDTSSISVPSGYAVNIHISADGYTTFNEIVPIFRDQSINIILDPIVPSDTHIVKVVPTPSDATVTINGVVGNEQQFQTGTRITIVVSRDHYTSSTIETVVNSDLIYEVNLVADKMTFTITPTPSDSVVIINGIAGNSATLDYGSTVDWSVSREGYIEKSGTLTLTDNTTLPVSLDKQQVTVTLKSVPDNATIKINNVEQTSITVEYGTLINYEVSANGYVTATGSIVANKTETRTIVLEKTYVSIVQGETLFAAAGGTNSIDIESNTGWIFK